MRRRHRRSHEHLLSLTELTLTDSAVAEEVNERGHPVATIY